MVELLVVITAAVLLLILFLFYVQRASAKRERIECVNHLKEVGLSSRIQSTDNDTYRPSPGGVNNASGLPDELKNGVPSFIRAMTNIASPRIFVCPADKQRSPAKDWSEVSRDTISYFFNLEGSEVQPQALLSGDSNLTTNGVTLSPGVVMISPGSSLGWSRSRHQSAGNIVLGDGSVQQATGPRLAELTSNSPPMRLWVP
jgi:hypothetical protein